jgi:hypothetical protein
MKMTIDMIVDEMTVDKMTRWPEIVHFPAYWLIMDTKLNKQNPYGNYFL